MKKFIIFLSIILLYSLVYADQTYIWEDENGLIHITQQPPPENAKTKKVVPYKKNTYTGPPESSRQQPDKITDGIDFNYLYDAGCRKLKGFYDYILSGDVTNYTDKCDEAKKASDFFNRFTNRCSNERNLTASNSRKVIALDGMGRASNIMAEAYIKENKFEEGILSAMKAIYCFTYILKINCDDRIEQLNLNIPINNSPPPPWEDPNL